MRDCKHCKHYVWDLDRKYQSCELWNCEEENVQETEVLSEMASGDNGNTMHDMCGSSENKQG